MDDAFLKKTEKEIRKEVFEIATSETGISNFKSTGVLRGLLETFTRVMGQLYLKFLSPIYRQTSLMTAEGEWLSQWGLLLGVARKLATKTRGNVSLTASDDGQIDAGTWITVAGVELRFKVLETTAFSSGEIKAVPVEAEFAGSEYNVSDDKGVLAKIVQGVKEISFGADWITEPGTDDEKDTPYRERVTNRWIALGVGNPPASFEYHALTVDGVASVKIIRTPRGYGTADVIVVASNGMPTQALLDAVYKALEDHALICNDLQVKAPAEHPVSVKIEFSGTSTANEVQEKVLQYIYALGIGGRMEIRGIYSVLEDLKLDKVEVLEPARDVQAEADAIVVAAVEVIKKE